MASTSSSTITLGDLPTDKHEQMVAVLRLFPVDGEVLTSETIGQHYRLPDNVEKLVGLFKSLQAAELITFESHTRTLYKATGEGQDVLTHGSPEFRVWRAASELGAAVDQKELEGRLGAGLVKIGWGQCLRLGWLSLDKATKKATASPAPSIGDATQQQVRRVTAAEATEADHDAATIKELRKRALIAPVVLKSFTLTKTAKFTTEPPRPIKEMTLAVLESGEWRTQPMKPFNLNAQGAALSAGYLHPLMKVRTLYTEIFLEMGFEEMPTAQYVENGFWNFDALFQPQQHPARDAHDTFFMADPARTTDLPDDYVQRVKTMHERGGHDSIGWRYDWAVGEAQKNILRTHTTAVSARQLYQLGQEYQRTGVFTPKKLFSVDKVYRNEALDATHLAEFHQIEGLIADRNITLGNLIGVIREFFKKLGITNLRFKPAFNPYTEPSMEVFGYHDGLGKWVELGNSGMFRPEMLAPMGLPPDVNVIAWGLSLERPTMIKYHLQNIRTLVGHNLDLEWCRGFPIVRD